MRVATYAFLSLRRFNVKLLKRFYTQIRERLAKGLHGQEKKERGVKGAALLHSLISAARTNARTAAHSGSVAPPQRPPETRARPLCPSACHPQTPPDRRLLAP